MVCLPIITSNVFPLAHYNPVIQLPFCSLNNEDFVPVSEPLKCCSLCLECFSRQSHDSVLHFLQIFSKMLLFAHHVYKLSLSLSQSLSFSHIHTHPTSSYFFPSFMFLHTI